MDALLDVVQVEVKRDYRLLLEFENGERRVFDLSPYLNQEPFCRLKELPLFKQASVEFGTVIWPGDIDIAPETLYDRFQPV